MIKDVLVYLDGGVEDDVRLAYAEGLARTHEAFVTGLHCNIVPEMMLAGEPGLTAAQVVVEMQQAAIEAGNRVAASLKEKLESLDISSEFRRLDLFAGQAGHAVAAEARRADLFVTSRPSEDGSGRELAETVLFNSGRGVVLVPPGYRGPAQADVALIAWRNTREAARALAESVPLLRRGKKAIVAVVTEDAEQDGRDAMPGSNISRHLDRHGITVELNEIPGRRDAAAALLEEAKTVGAGLIVMGGYGHSRFREWVLGGVTRDILAAAEVPVLLAH